MTIGFLRSYSPRTKRIITIAAFFIISIIATTAGALTPLSREDANSMNQEIDQLRKNISVQYIFGNNFMLCMIMFVPIVGTVFGLWVLYNTGVFIAAQSIAGSVQGIPPLLTFFTLFLFPFTWMEFISYSTGFAEGIWLIRRSLQGFGRREIKNAAVLIAIVAVILLVAAIIETALIMAAGGL